MNLPPSLAEACAAAHSLNSSGVYFLRLRSGQLYIRSTADLRQRLVDHSSGRACRTTAWDESGAERDAMREMGAPTKPGLSECHG